MKCNILIWLCLAVISCNVKNETPINNAAQADSPYVVDVGDSTIIDTVNIEDSLQKTLPPSTSKFIDTKNTKPDQLISFAQTLIGVPYVYGSANPKVGFDCSGFITYVFNHFKIPVARSSVDFTDVGKRIDTTVAKKGDIILFTGTNPAERIVGHMGLVISNDNGSLKFIHSTSGKQMSVTITELNDYYRKRFVSIRRIFPQNDM